MADEATDRQRQGAHLTGVPDAQTAVDHRRESPKDSLLVGKTIDHVQQAALSKPGQQGLGLRLVQVETAADCLLGVVGTPTGHHAGRDLVDRHVQIDRCVQRRVDLGQETLQGGGLVRGPRIAIQQEPALDHIVTCQALGNDLVDEVVADQVAKALACNPNSVPAATAARSMLPVETWTGP